MYISFGQLIIIVIVGFLLFGNLPKQLQNLRNTIKEYSKDVSNTANDNTKPDNK